MSSNSIENRQIRQFGFIAFVLFGCLCALGIWMGKSFPIYLFGFFSILGLSFIIIPDFMRPVYSAWLKITGILSWIITTLTLTLAYYFVITPSGIIYRLVNGSPLPLKPDRKTSSYWVKRSEPSQAKKRFLKRY